MTRYALGKIEILKEPLVTRLVCKNGMVGNFVKQPPVNKAVSYTWHKEHCHDHVLQRHPEDSYMVCSTCGHNVQIPNK